MSHRADPRGTVVLVGAGAGDESLASASAISWISRAETIIYDRLACPSLLARARRDARMIFVGKAPGRPGMGQDHINELLVAEARAGRLVVRLKGGDPLIFGRGGEEAQALYEAGVPFRIVPGITAAAVAAAMAGIPLTDRRFASSVAFVTAQRDPAAGGPPVNWAALAGVDTLVVYMGVANLPEVVESLLAAGRDVRTPAAIVASAGTARQKTVTAPLAELPAAARKAGIAAPAVTIVGPVVTLREQIAWLEKLPLHGRTVLVTRPRQQADELAGRLAELGAGVIEAPAIEIAPPADPSALDDALRGIGRFDLLAVTSANAVRAVLGRCRELGIDGRALAGVTIAAVGPATADALRDGFLTPDIVPDRYTADDLAEAILAAGDWAGKRMLLARSDIAPGDLPGRLRRAGATVTEVAAYRTVRAAALPDEAVEALRERQVHWVTFASASAVRGFLELLAEGRLDASEVLAGPVRLAAIGPVTAEGVSSACRQPDAVADEHTAEGLVAAILDAEGPRSP